MRSLVLLIALIISVSGIFAQATPAPLAPAENSGTTSAKAPFIVPPEKARPIAMNRFEVAPVIDGNLDEPAWQQAAVFKDFVQIQPGDNIAPSKPTIAYIGYDSRQLYLAFHCFDDPDKIRATVAARDSVFGEDNVRVYLDTFNDQRRAYLLGWNPLGIQADALFTAGAGTDFSFDIVMESKGRIVSDGWTLEVAIPFKSLRYEAGEGKQWGIHIWRNIDRFNDELDSWMPISRDKAGVLNQAGHIANLTNISTERTLEIIPTVKVSEDGERIPAFPNHDYAAHPNFADPGRMLNGPVRGEFGLSVKYTLTPTVTLDAAYNPDFADVEADAPVLQANQRFPIFFAEKRPFFLEGKDIFNTPQQVLYTRTIADPDLAVKLSGKRGLNSFGLLFASDNAPNGDKPVSDNNALVVVARGKRDIGAENSLGFIATLSRFAQNRNTVQAGQSEFIRRDNLVAGVDGRFRLGAQQTLNFQLLGTTAHQCFNDFDFDAAAHPTQAQANRDECGSTYRKYRTGNGLAYVFGFSKESRHFSWNYNAQGRNRTYRADVGFTRRFNTNYQGMFFNYNSEPNPKAKIISWRIGGGPNVNFDWQGRLQNQETNTEFSLRLQRNAYAGAGIYRGYERVFEDDFGPRRQPGNTNLGFARNDPERSTVGKSVYFFAGANPSKKYGFNVSGGYDWSTFHFDGRVGPRFQRVSPGVIAQTDFRRDPGPAYGPSGSVNLQLQPLDTLNFSVDYNYNKLTRNDTQRVAFVSHIFSVNTQYQFTRFVFLRGRLDYETLGGSVNGQYLFGWTPKPGTAFYVGYNDNLSYRGFNYFNPLRGDLPETGFRRDSRTFFIKLSYLFRKSFGG